MQRLIILNKNNISKFDLAQKMGSNEQIFEKDKDLYIATRIIENIILNGREKHIGVEGKPYMNGQDKYNLSNYGDFACGYISTDGEVGVDILKIHHFDDHFIERIYSNEEREKITSDIDATKAWTIKEACIKCVGIGLKGLHNVEIKNDFCCKYLDREFNYKSFEYKGYMISVVSGAKIDIDSVEEI